MDSSCTSDMLRKVNKILFYNTEKMKARLGDREVTFPGAPAPTAAAVEDKHG